jgi:hypothetical protein
MIGKSTARRVRPLIGRQFPMPTGRSWPISDGCRKPRSHWLASTPCRRSSRTASETPSAPLRRGTRRMACEHRSLYGDPSGPTANVAQIAKQRNHLRPMREAAVAAIARDSDCEADAAAPE